MNCPECHTPLRVARNDAGEIIGQEVSPPEPPAAVPAAAKRKQQASTPAQSNVQAKGKSAPAIDPRSLAAPKSHVPQILTWVVAGLCLLALIPFLIPSRKPVDSVANNTDQQDATDNQKSNQPEITDVKPKPADDGKPQPLPDAPEARLKELGRLVLKQAETDGHFPAGSIAAGELKPNQRWSWLAQIAAKQDNPGAILIPWNQRWNDPAYDRFVRRGIPRFQNPQVKGIISEDSYPATHFVGVAGVGADAPSLPVDHPRAGVFGQDRQTKADQIHDGLSNTMLIAGVEDHLHSWAEGSTSYRPFTQQPYIHGADGFGTGQPDRMYVLMADGSVRQINQKTNPGIVRRMAAMNDGLPLDINTPGEPGDPKPGASPMPNPAIANANAAGNNAAKPNPADAAAPMPLPEVKPLDIPGALSRKVLKFDQAKPAAAFKLILQIEELSGIRIEYDRKQLGAAADRLDKQITLRKENASLEELLDDVLKQIDLQRQSEATCIRIVAAERT